MKLPKLNQLQVYREAIDTFGGYNHNLRIGDGEFYDMTNLTSDDYPVLSPRAKRGVYVSEPNGTLSGVIAKDRFVYAAGRYIYIDGKAYDMELTEGEKTLVTMGAYVIIMPDKKWINVIDAEKNHGARGDIEHQYEGDVTYKLCDIDGNEYGNIAMGDVVPTSPKNGDKWLDTKFAPNVLKQYDENSKAWFEITSYVKITFPDESAQMFSTGESVFVKDITVTDVEDEHDPDGQLVAINKIETIVYSNEISIVVKGQASYSVNGNSLNGTITIERKMPNMDFIIESENRLWGCRYGLDLDGKHVNEIYACKLGDFKSWYCFEGISTDSYVASLGSGGKFTGAVTYLGYPMFFKENCCHKVYGNYPSNYQIQTTLCKGVQDGCSKSLATVNSVLYYKSRSGVCSFDGSLPADISYAFGDAKYSSAVAGALGSKYYISMMDDPTNKYHLFVLDTARGLWHREDSVQAVQFCEYMGELYYIDYDTNQIHTVKGTGYKDDRAVEWEAITGILGMNTPDKKYISRIDIRMMLSIGSSISIYAEYDSMGGWHHLLTKDGVSLQSFSLPIKPNRCDHFRLKIVGRGDAKIFSLCKNLEKGSEM